MFHRSVLAWIECRAEDAFEGAFVAEAVDRLPATQIHRTADCARRWIEREAEAIAATVKWLDRAPAGVSQ